MTVGAQRRRVMDPSTRRRVMASIKGRDTKPELALREALRHAGLAGYRCHTRMPGRPDIAYTRWRVAVFVDGVWWHGHPAYFRPGIRGEYWDRKIAGNMKRDKNVDAELRGLGWVVLRFWDVDIERSPAPVVARVRDALWARGRAELDDAAYDAGDPGARPLATTPDGRPEAQP